MNISICGPLLTSTPIDWCVCELVCLSVVVSIGWCVSAVEWRKKKREERKGGRREEEASEKMREKRRQAKR